MGSDPDDFPSAARRLVTEGYDCIDINFGCPVKKVLGRCRGGYLLGVPETALEIVDRVREAVPERVPVTLKMRRGIDDSAASEEAFWRIFEAPSIAASRRSPFTAARWCSATRGRVRGDFWPR